MTILDHPPVTGSDDEALEQLTRRLLELLGRVTGLESTYLTSIDWEDGVQQILYARNVGSLDIPEGISVDWSDTLCRRALDGGPMYTTDVEADLPGCEAARELGLSTYVTVPVLGPAGDLFGTVCGADSRGIDIDRDALGVMEALAEMVSMQLRTAATVRELEATNLLLRELAFVDGLTGVGNRRALDRDLPRSCEEARSEGVTVSVLSVDVDRFKEINDRFGHVAGDEVLQEVARRLTSHCRAGDVVTRFGGDEFVAVLVGADAEAASAIAQRVRTDVAAADIATSVGRVPVTISVGVAGSAGVEDPDDLLRRADLALYLAKSAGRDGMG